MPPSFSKNTAAPAVPSPAPAPTLVPVCVDGETLELPEGANLLEALGNAGKKLPHLCYHEKLSTAGNCGMCVVEIGTAAPAATGRPATENASPKILWQPQLAAACASRVAAGMHLRLNSPAVRTARADAVETLLLNHPLDCSICDKAGECLLQECAAAHGRGFSRHNGDWEKSRKPKHVRLSPRIVYDAERCILCSRCERFCREVLKDLAPEAANDDTGGVHGGVRDETECYVAATHGRALDNNYSLNTVDLCPTGALTEAAFRFKMRVWFLKRTPSISPDSSVGVNTHIWSRSGKIYRITPRRNDAVNDCWMPDSARYLHTRLNTPDRMAEYLCDGVTADTTTAVSAAAQILRTAASAGKLAYVVSGRLAVEEQALLRELRDAAPGPVWLPRRAGTGDGLLLGEDRTPNLRGALLTGLCDHAGDDSLASLADALGRGEIAALAVFREDITALGVTGELLKKHAVKVVYLTTHADALTVYADAVFPALSVFEKDGSFVNEQFRLQKFLKAVPGPHGIVPETALLRRLADATNATNDATGKPPDASDGAAAETPESVWRRLGARAGVFAGLTFAGIPPTGVLLDATAWAHLRFPGTRSLHHTPPAP
ncbi:MAG: (2Fe-2S)-binding protein [Puniceicoccales bacterium]|nr:(2Fe-2S)-binding protein [Puniceicoccales bacterium]